MMTLSPRALDLAIVGVCVGVSAAIGFYFSRRQTGTSSYFLGKGRMPGWLIGFSIAASMISALSFLAIPAFSFQEDWRWVLPSFSFLIMAVFAMIVLMPFFRQVTTPSGYAFLEQRFGTWARVYAAAGFLLFRLLRLGMILYVTCLSLEIFLGVPAARLIFVVGAVATLYTLMGGFEAVVWSEFFQASILIAGAVIIVPASLHLIPGGLGKVFDLAIPAGKMSLGRTHFNFVDKTIWVMAIASLFSYASDFTTGQDFIQRYRAPRSIGQARLALGIGAALILPIWLYFNFVGTVLWTFYQVHPDPQVAVFAAHEPERIVPYFMVTHLPAGLNGLVLAALSMASLSVISSTLNATAVTWLSDFHQRFVNAKLEERQLVALARRITAAIGAIMIAIALLIQVARTQTMQDLQYTGATVFCAGLFSLFMIGFFSNRIGKRSALCATIGTVLFVALWLVLDASPVRHAHPGLAGWIPDTFWVPVFGNLLLPALAFLFSRIFKDRPVVNARELIRAQALNSPTPP
jgi:SSS family solute:Na+ symporter